MLKHNETLTKPISKNIWNPHMDDKEPGDILDSKLTRHSQPSQSSTRHKRAILEQKPHGITSDDTLKSKPAQDLVAQPDSKGIQGVTALRPTKIGNKEHSLESLHGNSLRGIVSGILQSNIEPKTTVSTVIIAQSFPFWLLAAKGLDINLQFIILKEKKWICTIRMVCPDVQIILLVDILSIPQITVDLILVNSCGIQEVNEVYGKIQSQFMLFDSRIRGTVKDHTRYDGKVHHWMVGGATNKVFQYTLFSKADKNMKVWLSFTPPSKPHTDILLHTNSATPMSRERTRQFACRGYKELTQQEYDTPHVQQITKDVYHPSGLFPHSAEKMLDDDIVNTQDDQILIGKTLILLTIKI